MLIPVRFLTAFLTEREAAPRRSWRRARATWRAWSSLDPLTRADECERFARGVALGLALAFAAWAAVWSIGRWWG